MSRFGMRSLNRLFSRFFWFNLSAFRLASPPGGMRLPPEVEPCTLYYTLYPVPVYAIPRRLASPQSFVVFEGATPVDGKG